MNDDVEVFYDLVLYCCCLLLGLCLLECNLDFNNVFGVYYVEI